MSPLVLPTPPQRRSFRTTVPRPGHHEGEVGYLLPPAHADRSGANQTAIVPRRKQAEDGLGEHVSRSQHKSTGDADEVIPRRDAHALGEYPQPERVPRARLVQGLAEPGAQMAVRQMGRGASNAKVAQKQMGSLSTQEITDDLDSITKELHLTVHRFHSTRPVCEYPETDSAQFIFDISL